MRTRGIALISVLLLLGAAGTSAAVRNSDSYEAPTSGEKNPWCTGGAEESAITADPTVIDDLAGTDFFSDDDKVNIPLSFSIGDETVFFVCSGEHWNSQDPNTRDSSEDTRAEEDGDVYVNPQGDCSSYDGSYPESGCSGGTQRPTGATDPVHVRVTASADTPATGSESTSATTYQNLEIYGVGREANTAHADTAREAGYVGLYLEDHSDQIFNEDYGLLADTPLADPLDHGDGNYLTIPFDPVLAGEAGEGDCNQDRYQSDQPCVRDNTAITVEYGYGWAPTGSNSLQGPTNLP